MRTLILVVLSFIFVPSVFAAKKAAAPPPGPTVLVDYDYGALNVRSGLQIYSDGSIKHTEATCCPPQENEIKEDKLSDQKMADLRNWIKDAAAGQIATAPGQPTRVGSPSGSLTSTLDETISVDHVIKRGPVSPEAYDQVQKNQSNGARQIEDLVNTYVKNRMYQ